MTDTTQTPMPQPNAAPAPPAPMAVPDVNAPVPGTPNISAMAAPSTQLQPSIQGTQEYAPVAAAQKAYEKAVNTPVAAPSPVPHQRLLGMISGLAEGLSAASQSIATHGREGGAPAVQEYYAKQQDEKIQAQEAAAASRNQDVQQKIQAFGIAQQQFDNHIKLLTLGDDMTAKHLEVQRGQQDLATGAQAQQIQLADFQKQNWGFTPQEITGAQSGQSGTAVDPSHISTAQTMLNRTVGNPADPNTTGAIAILGKDNPAVANAIKVAGDPNANVQQILAAGQGLTVALQQSAAVTEAKKNQAGAASAMVDAQNKLGSQAAYNAKHIPGEDFATWQARQTETMKQQVQEGDPAPLGEALAAGLIAPSQVLSSRSMSKPFYSQVLKAANDASMKSTGKPYDAATAEAQFKYAQAPKTQNTLNLLDAITRPGGSLEVVTNAASKLPGLDEQTLNKVFSGVRSEFGDSRITDFNAALVGFANEYSGVMSAGGAPTDNETKYALSVLQKGYASGQLAGSLTILNQDLNARGKSIIRDNPVLNHQYPELAAVGGTQAGSSIKNPSAIPGIVIH